MTFEAFEYHILNGYRVITSPAEAQVRMLEETAFEIADSRKETQYLVENHNNTGSFQITSEPKPTDNVVRVCPYLE